MNQKSKNFTAILLAISVVFSLFSINTFATTEGTASVPIRLTVVNNYKNVSVTVPAFLPVEIYNGTVITADNAKISNKSNGNVKVSAVTVQKGSFDIGDYENFSGNNKIALKINGIPTTGAGKMNISSESFPVISGNGNLSLKYYAKISGNASSMKDVEVAKVIFTISTVD